MKKLALNLSPRGKRVMHFTLYIVILIVLVIALIFAKELPEVLGYTGLSIFCIVSMVKDTRRSNFDTLKTLVQQQCEPKQALDHLATYPHLLSKEEFALNGRLLKAYALIDSGDYDGAVAFIEKNRKSVFNTAYAKTVVDYMLLQVAALRDRKGEAKELFAALQEKKESFIVDKETGTPGALWYMAEGNCQLASHQYEQANELYEQVDTEQLKTNRDKAYYHCFRALIARGMEDEEAYKAHKQQAAAIAANVAAIQQL